MGEIKMEELKSFDEFTTKMLKKEGKKNFKVKGSFGNYDAYKLMRKNGWYSVGKPISEHDFYAVVRGINRKFAEALSHGETIDLPFRMGQLELRKSQRGVSIVDGKLKINYPVNWSETLKLWYEDAEARKNKTLLRNESKEVYSVKYNKWTARYENKAFYEFVLNRFIKKALKKNINDKKVNVLWSKSCNTQV